MCTALRMTVHSHYFGRNLDLHRSLGEQVCILPRRAPLPYRRRPTDAHHYALIGMAARAEGLPLYYDAANEHGLAMAGLNFPGNAEYLPDTGAEGAVAPFELIPWVLSRCATVAEAEVLLRNCPLTDIPFHPKVPSPPLHWMLCDKDRCLTLEPMGGELKIRENDVNVLTNNPPFPHQRFQLNNFRHLSPSTPPNTFAPGLDLKEYCQGLGGLGLPGDLSSMSRFQRMAFHRAHSRCQGEELACVGQFFHLLGSVEMPRGSCQADNGEWDYTVYSCCISTALGRYYYTTYDNRRICCVDLHQEDPEGEVPRYFPLALSQDVAFLNGEPEK